MKIRRKIRRVYERYQPKNDYLNHSGVWKSAEKESKICIFGHWMAILLAIYLIIKGLFLGNIIGLGIAFLQQKFQFISLDPNIYYMSSVPINFNFMHILGLNLGTLLVCWLILIIPSIIITKITPIKSIRFE